MSKLTLKRDRFNTLFLDRDGVITKLKKHGYVKDLDEFIILPGVFDALKRFNELFDRVIIATNQQGIGKGLMTDADLMVLHNWFLEQCKSRGIVIDKIYYCPEKESENPFNRKPNIGMGLMAKKDFPEIVFEDSIMVGDMVRDMEFGRNLGMKTVLVGPDVDILGSRGEIVDFYFKDLYEFSMNIEK